MKLQHCLRALCVSAVNNVKIEFASSTNAV